MPGPLGRSKGHHMRGTVLAVAVALGGVLASGRSLSEEPSALDCATAFYQALLARNEQAMRGLTSQREPFVSPALFLAPFPNGFFKVIRETDGTSQNLSVVESELYEQPTRIYFRTYLAREDERWRVLASLTYVSFGIAFQEDWIRTRPQQLTFHETLAGRLESEGKASEAMRVHQMRDRLLAAEPQVRQRLMTLYDQQASILDRYAVELR